MSKSSKSTQQQTTSQTDARLVVDGGSVGNSGAGGAAAGALAVVGSGNAFSLTEVTNITDGGIIESAFKYLEGRDTSNARMIDTVLEGSADVIKMAFSKVAGDASTQVTEANAVNAKNTQMLIYAALGALVIVASAKVKK